MARRKNQEWSEMTPSGDEQPVAKKRPSLESRRGQRKAGVKFTPSKIRIVSGEFRNRKLDYNGDPATRPMKEKTREAVFSLLGGKLGGTFAIDLFAGTSVLAIESVSRGSAEAIALELSRTVVKTTLKNLQTLGLQDRVYIQNVDTLRWLRSIELNSARWPDLPWIVFCCPPYKLWVEESERLCQGIAEMYAASPVGSQFVCETDKEFDIREGLPDIEWDVRNYPPAYIGVAEKMSPEAPA